MWNTRSLGCDPLEARLNALMIQVARNLALFDANKLGQRNLSVITPVRQLHAVITDAGAPADTVDALRQEGVRVTLV